MTSGGTPVETPAAATPAPSSAAAAAAVDSPFLLLHAREGGADVAGVGDVLASVGIRQIAPSMLASGQGVVCGGKYMAK